MGTKAQSSIAKFEKCFNYLLLTWLKTILSYINLFSFASYFKLMNWQAYVILSLILS